MYHVNDDLLCEDCFLDEVMDPDYIVDVTDPEAVTVRAEKLRLRYANSPDLVEACRRAGLRAAR